MKTLYLVLALAVICVGPVFAQGAFTDVPEEHWAYDAVEELQQEGLVAGYPNGTFQGKNPITRYEFATVIQRMLPMIKEIKGAINPDTGKVDLSGYVTKAELGSAITAARPDLTGLAKQSGLDTLTKLINEFKDELAAMGVDIDGVKRDLAALSARVDAVEAEQRRFRVTGTADIFGIGVSDNSSTFSPVTDIDGRTSSGEDALIRSAAVVTDMDLDITGRVNDNVTAVAKVNYGSYLNYAKSTSHSQSQSDDFFPYYTYVSANTGFGKLTMGRMPFQLTPYTFKMLDVDTYTTNNKTDSGNYPVDGAKFEVAMSGVGVTLFAAKHDSNRYVENLMSQVGLTTHVLGGQSIGGLNEVTQTAGVRATFGTAFNAKFGLTYYQAFDKNSWNTASYDTTDVMGIDLSVPVFYGMNLVGSVTDSQTKGENGADDIDEDTTAYDGAISGKIGLLGIGVGWKDIGKNFATAGDWDFIGRWHNPTNVKGIYADLSYPITNTITMTVGGQSLEGKDNFSSTFLQDDQVDQIKGGIKWAYSPTSSFSVDYQMVQFDQAITPSWGDKPEETYITLGWATQLGTNANLKVGYQLISYDAGVGGAIASDTVYGNDYRGGIGVVQMGVSF